MGSMAARAKSKKQPASKAAGNTKLGDSNKSNKAFQVIILVSKLASDPRIDEGR